MSIQHTPSAKSKLSKITSSRIPRKSKLSKSSRLKLSPSCNFGNKIYDSQSASTLFHSINSYTIPKAGRFTTDPGNGVSSPLNLGSSLSTNSISFPKKKRFGVKSHLDLLKSSPAPCDYTLPDEVKYKPFRNKSTKFAKGSSGRLKKLKKKPVAGPGSYKIRTIFEKSKGRGKSLAGKGRVFNEVDMRDVNDVFYDVSHKYTEQSRYSSVAGFSKGKRGQFLHEFDNRSPGPAYKLPSIFDRFSKKKV